MLASGDAHIDLMLVSDKAKILIHPGAIRLHIMPVSDLFPRL